MAAAAADDDDSEDDDDDSDDDDSEDDVHVVMVMLLSWYRIYIITLRGWRQPPSIGSQIVSSVSGGGQAVWYEQHSVCLYRRSCVYSTKYTKYTRCEASCVVRTS